MRCVSSFGRWRIVRALGGERERGPPPPRPSGAQTATFLFFQQAGVGGSVGPTGPDALAWGPPPGPIPRTIIPPLYVPLMSNPASLFFSGFANQLPNKHPLGQTDDSNTPPSALHFLPSFDWIGIFSDCAPPPFIIIPIIIVQVAERYGTSYDQAKRPPPQHPAAGGSGGDAAAAVRSKPSAADALPDRKCLFGVGGGAQCCICTYIALS